MSKHKEEKPPVFEFIIHLPGKIDIPLSIEGAKEYALSIVEKWLTHYHTLGPILEIVAPKDAQPEGGA